MDTQVIIFSFSIFVGTIIGWLRFKSIEPAFLSFLICLSIASVNEVISLFMTTGDHGTALNNNIYVLLEALLITWQFRIWGLFRRHPFIHTAILLLLIISWFIENFIVNDIFRISFYFRTVYSFIIVLMSINMSNNLILNYRYNILRSPVFLICAGFIVYFTYKILVEAFWFYGLNASRDFRINVYTLLTWINLIVNLIYALALLWIPKKPPHITLS